MREQGAPGAGGVELEGHGARQQAVEELQLPLVLKERPVLLRPGVHTPRLLHAGPTAGRGGCTGTHMTLPPATGWRKTCTGTSSRRAGSRRDSMLYSQLWASPQPLPQQACRLAWLPSQPNLTQWLAQTSVPSTKGLRRARRVPPPRAHAPHTLTSGYPPPVGHGGHRGGCVRQELLQAAALVRPRLCRGRQAAEVAQRVNGRQADQGLRWAGVSRRGAPGGPRGRASARAFTVVLVWWMPHSW